MDFPEGQGATSLQDINATVRKVQQEIIQALDELDAGLREVGSPDSLKEIVGGLRNSLTKLWLSHAAITLMIEEQHKD